MKHVIKYLLATHEMIKNELETKPMSLFERKAKSQALVQINDAINSLQEIEIQID